jgi:hypothetical protein
VCGSRRTIGWRLRDVQGHCEYCYLIESSMCSPSFVASTSTRLSILNMPTPICTSSLTACVMMYAEIVMTTGVPLPNSGAHYVSNTSNLNSTLTTPVIGIIYSCHSMLTYPVHCSHLLQPRLHCYLHRDTHHHQNIYSSPLFLSLILSLDWVLMVIRCAALC